MITISRPAVPPVLLRQGRRIRPEPLVFAGCLAIYLVWWAAFAPGLMSFDTVTYVWQATTGHWRADHSVLYNCLVWLSLRATGGLGLLTAAQAVGASAALTLLAVELRGLGVPLKWGAAAALATAAVPATGTFVVTVWKDVPFSICAILMTATLTALVSRRSPALYAAFAAEALGMCLFRANGFLFVAIAVVLAVALLKGRRTGLAIAALVPLALTFLFPLAYPLLSVEPVRPTLKYATAYGDIAVAYRDRPAAFTATDLAVMRSVAPLEHWRTAATCHNVDPTMNGSFSWTAADRDHAALVSLWTRVLKRSPDQVLGARLCRGSIAWAVFPSVPADRAMIAQPTVPRDLYGWWIDRGFKEHGEYRPALRNRPLWQPLHDAASFVRTASYTPQLEWLTWRGATWCYLAYGAVAAFALVRRRLVLLAPASVVAAQQIAVMAAIPAPLFRYMAGPIMIGIMTVPLLMCAVRERTSR